MKSNGFFIIIIYVFFVLSSCDRRSFQPSDYMVFDEVKYVIEFPYTFSLKGKIEPFIDIIGVKDIVIYDSIMILSTTNKDGLWSFVSLPECAHLGDFLTKGEGPFEFITPPSANDKTSIYKYDSLLFASIYDFKRGSRYIMNITESLRDNKLSIVEEKKSFPKYLFNIVMIDSVSVLCKEVDSNHTQQIRRLYKNKNITNNPLLQKLNQALIEEGEDINILSTMTKYSPINNLIVEMPIGLNYLNVYSLDSLWGKTICIGNTLDNIAKIQEKNRWDRMYTFSDLRLFSDFFGVVYINEDEKTYQTGRKRLPSIQLFNWQGEPLAELKLDHFITSFDIDFINGSLYTHDVHTDEIYKYQINDILTLLSE